MALNYRTFLDNVQVEEPTNVKDIEFSIIRDESLHGIGFQASNASLNFTEDGFQAIEAAWKAQGLKSNVVFRLEQNCDDDGDVWEVVFEGKANIGQRKKSCGSICMVSVPVESSTCETTMQSRYDQSVDIDKAFGFNGITALPGYFNLGINMELPTILLNETNEGYVLDADIVDMSDFNPFINNVSNKASFRATYLDKRAEQINQSELDPTEFFAIDHGIIQGTLSPVFLYDDNVKCFTGNFNYSFRLKGRMDFNNEDPLHILSARFDVFHIRIATGEYPDNLVDISTQNLPYTNDSAGAHVHTDFDYSFSGVVNLPAGQGLYVLIEMYGALFAFTGTTTFHVETHSYVNALKACPPSSAKVYMVHETLSRVTEAITDYCIRVKSSYYGRVDSEPFDFPTDGCGGLRMLTSGLKIRNAANPTFFASLKFLIESLQAIDNIGMGIEQDPDRPNQLLLRVEDLDYFYQNFEILRCPLINKADESVDIGKSYSKINAGYKKWETQDSFGLDEVNSTREFRTALTSVSSVLDITSGLVTGSYAFELTRQQQFVDTSQADTTYDNEIFLALLKRITALGYPYGEMVIEQGNIITPENMFSPTSIYNYGISPARNLMRWFRSIAASYPNIQDSDNRLYFSAGTGNILAKGELSELYGGTCRLEKVPIKENQDITTTVFMNLIKATPIWRNDIITYKYPMSLKDYTKIKANPYGYISFQCGTGDWDKGWIKEIAYKPADGMGTFTLKRKWS